MSPLQSGFVDAYDRGVEGQERSPGVPRIDRRVGLEHPAQHAAERGQLTVGRAEDPAGDARHSFLVEGEADGDHVAADLERGRLGESERLEPAGSDLDHGEVGRRVPTDQAGDDTLAVGEVHLEGGTRPVGSARDHVVIGGDVAPGVHDEAGAGDDRLIHRLLGRIDARAADPDQHDARLDVADDVGHRLRSGRRDSRFRILAPRSDNQQREREGRASYLPVTRETSRLSHGVLPLGPGSRSGLGTA